MSSPQILPIPPRICPASDRLIPFHPGIPLPLSQAQVEGTSGDSLVHGSLNSRTMNSRTMNGRTIKKQKPIGLLKICPDNGMSAYFYNSTGVRYDIRRNYIYIQLENGKGDPVVFSHLGNKVINYKIYITKGNELFVH